MPDIPSIQDMISKNDARKNSKDQEKATKFKNTLKPSATSLTKAYLREKYDFRYNTITNDPEYKLKGEITFKPLEDYKLNSLCFDLESEGVNFSTEKLLKLLISDFSEAVDPMENYFQELYSQQVIEGSIKELAQTVSVENQEIFEKYLTKWLVASVANTLTKEGCQNHTCLVLTGEQGEYKTTWLNNLCPKSLRSYLFSGKITVDSKDTFTMLAEFFIINVDDQLRNLNRKDENALKTLITLDSVKIRKPYGRFISKRPRLASFCGSINGNDFLTDSSGSRRFLPFEAITIDIERAKQIDMDAVWNEAYNLFKNGYVYWFTKEEVAILQRENQAFNVVETEFELLSSYFEPIARDSSEATFYQSSMIQLLLENHYGVKLNSRKLGDALRVLKFIRISKKENNTPRYVFAVKKIYS